MVVEGWGGANTFGQFNGTLLPHHEQNILHGEKVGEVGGQGMHGGVEQGLEVALVHQIHQLRNEERQLRARFKLQTHQIAFG